jgi:signal transduction histidine kinase
MAPVRNGAAGQDGTGLGPAITRRMFEVRGGSATAANVPGSGFVVTLELPLPDSVA